MNRAQLAAQLHVDEGRRPRIYLDTVGKWTGGVGRNLSDRPFSDDEMALMLKNDIATVEADLDRALPWWRTMSDARQQALANMCFNLGISRLLGFKKMLGHLQASRWADAAGEALDSKWADQVGARAGRIAEQLTKG